MTQTRADLRDFLLAWFGQHFPGNSILWYDILVLLWIASFALALHFILRALAKQFLKGHFVTLASDQPEKSETAKLVLCLVRRISFAFQGAIVVIQANLWLVKEAVFLHIVKVLTDQWIILFSLLSLFTLLDIFQAISDKRSSRVPFPLRGFLQTIKLIASVLTGILAVSLLMDKSPLILLSGLGALSAVLLLVFKDPILGLVAGIQLSANNMLAVGDWLEMPKYGADGDVIDIALTTVKVKNWDKTITTIPTYALISDSFKNWRGMTSSDGRRIKRSLFLKQNGVKYLTNADIEKLKKIQLISPYLAFKQSDIESYNTANNANKELLLNGRNLTNLGVFRKYIDAYLNQHSAINKDMMIMVRQLATTTQGIPLEIYAFSSDKRWANYEYIISDIFDHLIAALPYFELEIFELPSDTTFNT